MISGSGSPRRKDEADIIYVPNMLRLKVRRDPRADVEAALEEAHRAISALQPLFLDWAERSLGRIGAVLAEGDPEDRLGAAPLEEIYRIAHDIRGVAGTFGYDLLGQIANLLCDLAMNLATARNLGKSATDMALVGAFMHAMAVVLERRLSGDGGNDGAALVHNLDAIEKRRRDGAGGAVTVH